MPDWPLLLEEMLRKELENVEVERPVLYITPPPPKNIYKKEPEKELPRVIILDI